MGARARLGLAVLLQPHIPVPLLVLPGLIGVVVVLFQHLHKVRFITYCGLGEIHETGRVDMIQRIVKETHTLA